MNRITYILPILLMSISCYSQKLHLNLYEVSLDSLLKYEKSIGSELVESTSNYLSGKGIAQPIIFHRENPKLPNLKVQYTFYEIDSSMHKILYEWDISTFQKIDNNPQDSLFLALMLNQFNQINTLIDTTLKSEDTELSKLNMDDINSAVGFKQTNEWQPNDSLKIKNHITLKNSFKKTKFSTSPTVHRIRTYVNKVKPSPLKKLDKEEVAKLEVISTEFIKTIANDKSKSKQYLSEQIVDKITEEQIIQLEKVFEDAKPFTTISSGTEFGANYQYPFILVAGDSKSMNRKVTIKIIFDEKSKIIGIK